MRNRAKCKKCQFTIESFHRYDYVVCKCGEISINGGTDKYECGAKDWNNFIRIDDDENEIPIKVKESTEEKVQEVNVPSKEELIVMMDEMISYIEKLPEQAKYAPVSQYDFYSFMMIISALMKQ